LRKVNVNGGAFFASFAATGSRDFDWFATRNRWEEMDFFRALLAHPIVCAALPQVTKEARWDALTGFEHLSALSLDGELASVLVARGAYDGRSSVTSRPVHLRLTSNDLPNRLWPWRVIQPLSKHTIEISKRLREERRTGLNHVKPLIQDVHVALRKVTIIIEQYLRP
jgi:hypothetical protein